MTFRQELILGAIAWALIGVGIAALTTWLPVIVGRYR